MGKNKLNIVILAGSNPFNNAGIFAYDIFSSLKKSGHQVLLLTKLYDNRFEPGIESVFDNKKSLYIVYKSKILNKIRKLFGLKRDPSYSMISINYKKNYIPTKKIIRRFNFNPDVIIYVFPHNFLNSRNLYELNKSTKAPIFIMPVDMSHFTGGCHFSNGCHRYWQSCGKCPGIYSQNKKDITYRNLLYKKKYLNKTQLYTLSNQWVTEMVKNSNILSKKNNYTISFFVVNENIYKPGNSDLVKNEFEIEPGKKIIFFGATYLKDLRKGFSYLVEALNLLYNELL